MSAICRNKFWIYDPRELFCNMHIIPLSGATSEDQLNSITRLVLIVSLVVAIFDWKQGLSFFFSSILIVIIIYFVERKMSASKGETYCERYSNNYQVMTDGGCVVPKSVKQVPQLVENYEFNRNVYLPTGMSQFQEHPFPTLPMRGDFTSKKNYNARFPNSQRFCYDGAYMDYAQGFDNETYTSINQQLMDQGESKMNERTKIAPVIVPPPMDSDWSVDNLYVRSGINSDSNMDYISSGYIVQEKDECLSPGESSQEYKPIYHPQLDRPSVLRYNPVKIDPPFNPIIELYEGPKKKHSKHSKYSKDEEYQIKVGQNGGKVLTRPYYDPSQLKNFVPSNASVGPMQLSGMYDDYNENVVTQTLQPGLYTRSDIIEPVSENIGISFTQQLAPRTFVDNPDGSSMYQRHDGRVYREHPPEKAKSYFAPEDVYDPRQSGYGTSYRSYLDPRFGAPKFYYDDVDDIRRPKFILRSNVDHLSDEDSGSRESIDKAYREQTLYNRNDLAERAMSKINNLMYNRRLAPLRRDAAYNFKH